MFCEAYFIFSIGNIKPLFSYQYPSCFKSHKDGCSPNLTRGPDYSQILGMTTALQTYHGQLFLIHERRLLQTPTSECCQSLSSCHLMIAHTVCD